MVYIYLVHSTSARVLVPFADYVTVVCPRSCNRARDTQMRLIAGWQQVRDSACADAVLKCTAVMHRVPAPTVTLNLVG